jgi:hypothetical protein
MKMFNLKNRWVHRWGIGGFILLLLTLLFQTLKVIYHLDVSMHLPYTGEGEMHGNIWLTSYADGPTHIANRNAFVVSALNKGADFYLPYTAKHLDPDFAAKNAAILTQKRGAGFWLWKPHVILKTLSLMGPSDILIYADSGCLVVAPLSDLAKRLTTTDRHVLVFQNFHPNGPYTKRDLLRLMHMDTQEVRAAKQLQGSFLVVKNTPQARALLQEWLTLCEDERALTDRPSIEEYPDFIDHRHDQAILSLLWLKHPDLFLALPHEETADFFRLHRRRKFKGGSIFLRAYVIQPWRKIIHWSLLCFTPGYPSKQ